LIPLHERNSAIILIDEAVSSGARRFKACELLGINLRTFFRWKKNTFADQRKGSEKTVPRKLTEQEQQIIVQLCCSEKFKDSTPYDIYYSIMEEDSRYIASIRTIYRVLHDKGLLHHRGRCKPRKSKIKPPEVIATGPDQVYCWDITWLSTEVRGQFLYAYTIIDIWDKAVVGWEIHDKEDDQLARDLFKKILGWNNLKKLHVHSDNGHPMKGMNLISFLYSLKISVSRSRPSVSNDNPFIESYFKTMKYSVCYPDHFKGIEYARKWMADFVNWYNTEHRHSGIGYITPQKMRSGEYKEIYKKRNEVIREAFNKNRCRWSHAPKQWSDEHRVYLNPSMETRQDLLKKKNVA